MVLLSSLKGQTVNAALNFPAGAASATPSASMPVQSERAAPAAAPSAPQTRPDAVGANKLPSASAVAGVFNPSGRHNPLPADTPRPFVQLINMAREGAVMVTQGPSVSANQRSFTVTGQSKDGSALTITATASRENAKAPWSTRYELRSDAFAHAVEQRPVDDQRGRPTRYTTTVAPLDHDAGSRPLRHEVLPDTGEVNFRELTGGKVGASIDNWSLLTPTSFPLDDLN
jgi:hypothetical protein